MSRQITVERAYHDRSSAYLRRFRRLYAEILYNAIMDGRRNNHTRNELLQKAANRCAEHGVYARPKNYDPDNPRTTLSIRSGLFAHFFRIWKRKQVAYLRKKHNWRPGTSDNDVIHAAYGHFAWNQFAQQLGFSVYGAVFMERKKIG